MSIDEAFRQAWETASPLSRKRFVDACREFAPRGPWVGSYRQSYTRVLHWMDPEAPAQLPAWALEHAIRELGDARFLEPLLAAELRMLRERERAERMKRVEPEPAPARRRA